MTHFQLPPNKELCVFKAQISRGIWVAQSVKRCTLAQVIVSWPMGSSPTSGSVLTAQSRSLLQILCLPLCLPLPHSHSLCLKNEYMLKKKLKNKAQISQNLPFSKYSCRFH